MRETFNTAVSQIRKTADTSDVDVEGTIADLRSRLDDMISRVGNTVNGENQNASDIVEGEIVDDADNTNNTGN